MAHQATSLGPTAGFFWLAGQPEEALGTQQPAIGPLAVEEAEEALGMEGPPGVIGGRSDSVGIGLRHMLATQFLQPTGGTGSALEVEKARVEDLLQLDLAHDHGQDASLGIEPLEDGGQFLALVGVDQIDLADEQHIGELHLFDQQFADAALVVAAQGLTLAGQGLRVQVVAQEVHPIDDCDKGVQPRQVGQALALLVTEGEGLGHRQRLGDAGGLDQQIVEASLAGQSADFFQQVLAQGAADAAVAHLHQPFLGAVQADVALHFAGVDIDLAHVVDYHGNAQSLAVPEHMIEQCALPCAEEAGQQGNG
ncbi:hypothetical protein D3C84_557450 [compost metagenome]